MTKVIFLQGIHNFRIRKKFVSEIAHASGAEVVYFPMFYSLYQPAKHRELISKVNTYLDASDDRFIILGHSFGGILSYCLREDLYEKVDRIITVAAPHQVEFKWFKKILEKLPYRKDVQVPAQESYGFLFDTTVPFMFTRYHNTQKHQNLLGVHNRILDSREFVRALFLRV